MASERKESEEAAAAIMEQAPLPASAEMPSSMASSSSSVSIRSASSGGGSDSASSPAAAAAASSVLDVPRSSHVRFSMLWCAQCKAVEFPGCVDHKSLLASLKSAHAGTTSMVVLPDGSRVAVTDPCCVMSCTGCEAAAADWDSEKETKEFIAANPGIEEVRQARAAAIEATSVASAAPVSAGVSPPDPPPLRLSPPPRNGAAAPAAAAGAPAPGGDAAAAAAEAAAALKRRPQVICTSNCSPWCEACRFCQMERAQQYSIVVTREQMSAFVERMSSSPATGGATPFDGLDVIMVGPEPKQPERMLPQLLRRCDACHAARWDPPPPKQREGEACAIEAEPVVTHVVADCTGNITTLPMLLPKLEFEFLRDSLASTPSLRETDVATLNRRGASSSSASSPSPSPSSQRASSKAVHAGVRCDVCATMPLVGIRYSCSVCPDFDICESCNEAQQRGELPPTSRAFGGGAHRPGVDRHSAVHPLVQLTRPESLGFYRHVAFSRARARLAHTLPESQPMSSPGWPREMFLVAGAGAGVAAASSSASSSSSSSSGSGSAPVKGISEDALDAMCCPICMDVVKDPKLTDCGHMYCSFCLMKSCVSRRECPLDRQPLCEDLLYTSSPRELSLRAQINALGVTCPHRAHGCAWTGQLQELHAHLKTECGLVDCNFGVFGCGRLLKRTAAGQQVAEGAQREHDHAHDHSHAHGHHHEGVEGDESRSVSRSPSPSASPRSASPSPTPSPRALALVRATSSTGVVSTSASSASHTSAHLDLMQRQLLAVCESVEVLAEQVRSLHSIVIPTYERSVGIAQRVAVLDRAFTNVNASLRNHGGVLQALWDRHQEREAEQGAGAARGGVAEQPAAGGGVVGGVDPAAGVAAVARAQAALQAVDLNGPLDQLQQQLAQVGALANAQNELLTQRLAKSRRDQHLARLVEIVLWGAIAIVGTILARRSSATTATPKPSSNATAGGWLASLRFNPFSSRS